MKRSVQTILDQSAAPQDDAGGGAVSEPRPLVSEPSGSLSGEAMLPGDKSISHRALIFGALAVGETRVQGLLEGGDVLATARALGDFGVEIARDDTGTWRVWGVGVGGFQEPARQLDLGNAGTAIEAKGLAEGKSIEAKAQPSSSTRSVDEGSAAASENTAKSSTISNPIALTMRAK